MPGCCSVCVTLLRRKEALLKANRCCSSICEILIPIFLSAIVLVGALISDRDKFPTELFVPDNSTIAFQDLSLSAFSSPRSLPTFVPPLPLFLAYAALLNSAFSQPGRPSFAKPYDGSYLAVVPDTPEVRAFVQSVISRQPRGWMIDPTNMVGASVYATLQQVSMITNRTLSIADFHHPPLEVRYLPSDEALEVLARARGAIWAGLVFTSIPVDGVGTWEYKLRYNASLLPQSNRFFDRFPGQGTDSALSKQFYSYYRSGFLSLQAAINERVLLNSTRANSSSTIAVVEDDVLPYGAPFPVLGFERNSFFNFAGSLVGLVCVLAFLIPVSTTLRTLVLEKESKLREQLLMMGVTLPAYYGSVLTTFGASFFIIAAISGVIISIGCFTLSSPGIVAILFILFALASLAFTLAISSLFRNSRVAALAGPLIFFLTSQLYNVFLERGELQEGMNGAKALTSLFPAMGFYLAASLMAKYEGTQVGITAKNFATAGGGFSVANSIAILFFDIWLWLFIAWYFDQVLPSDYGLQQRPWFLCSPSYWFGKKNEPLALRALIADDANRPLAVEPMDEPMGARGVVVQGLRKVWPPRRVAVESLDMEMRSGQITSLLGANGAGKTTTISMLTGLMPPTSGNATVDGLSITSHMTTIRYSLGVCPQQNVLFDQLTPVQHLSLYGAIKGLEGAALRETIDLLISKVMLSERKDVQARNLSGGQKRKLCLAISLIGGAKTIFLDEPTSGMDPHSRRSIWALLREQREGRTIVLTTHFLDEAEILSDRIAIMAEGKLKCVGSPLFLKEHLGTGYALTITKTMAAASAKFDKEMLLTFVKKHVPLATLQSETKREASVRLPGDKLSMFQSLFEELDKNFRQLGIDDYGATCTTLEDVFLKINSNALQRLEDQKDAHNDASVHTAGHSDSKVAAAPLEILPAKGELKKGASARSSPDSHATPRDSAPLSQTGATMHMYSGLVAKRRIAARRDCYTTCCMIFFPVSLVFGALALLGVAGRITAIPDPVALLPDPLFPNGFGGRIPRPVPLTVPKGNLAETLLPQLAEDGWTGFQYRANSTPNEFMQVTREMEAYVLANPSEFRPAAMAWSPGVRIPPASTTTIFGGPFCLGIGPGPCPATSNSSVSVVTLMHNATNWHSMPILINTLYDALLLQATGGASTITGYTQDLPLDDASKAYIDSFIAVFAAILIMVPYSFVGATFVTPLVREKESGSKEMQFICGVGTVTYWFASWTWDLCMYLIIELASFIVFIIFNREEFIGTPEAFWGTILILLGFGWSVLGLSSMVSFYFKTPSNALIVMIAFHFLTGFGMVVADFILENIESTKLIIVGLRHFFRIFPAYCLGQGFVTLATRKSASAVSALIPGLPSDPTPGLYEWDQLGAIIFYLFVTGLIFGLATLGFQYGSSYVALRQRMSVSGGLAAATGSTSTTEQSALEDDSVIEERRRVDAGDTKDSMLVLSHMRKVFTGVSVNRKTTQKIAVRDLSLRIDAGECFGFLGVNGAGKSTTFSMLTGMLVPTSGDATLNGMSILSEQEKIRRLVGYCSQHDTLEHLLTARETLRMYAKIKKVDPAIIEFEVDQLIKDLDLGKFADKPAGTYSGGNKRKLCVGIALIGNPQLVMLDEPSSGMDAASKRFLWTLIKRRTAEVCTVLTTHSMEECEALCGRIGVMVDGTLRCLGPIQSLKSQYGQGYKLDLRLDMANHADPQKILQMLQERCAGIKTEEFEPPSLVLTVPQGALKLASLFGLLDELKGSHHVQECSVTQCTLEQIFILMASKANMRPTDTTGIAVVDPKTGAPVSAMILGEDAPPPGVPTGGTYEAETYIGNVTYLISFILFVLCFPLCVIPFFSPCDTRVVYVYEGTKYTREGMEVASEKCFGHPCEGPTCPQWCCG